jgi:hypothetical protein
MADPTLISVVLGIVAKKSLETLAGKVSEEVWKKLQGDPAQKAFAQALGVAINRYASSATGLAAITRLKLAVPLSGGDSPLKEEGVAAELAQVFKFDSRPNTALVGQRWKESLPDPPAWIDFTEQSELLLKNLEIALRDTDVYRPVFEAKDIAQVRGSAATAAEKLTEVSSQLASLSNLLTTDFGRLIQAFLSVTPSIRDQIRDFSLRINEKTQGFVGRQFVFDALDRFLEREPCGYFIVRGEPGIGKTSLAAQLIKTRGYIHHFNVRAEGINKADAFLRNACAQLIAVYHLPHAVLPPEAIQDGGYLGKLLEEVSHRLAHDAKAALLIDSLDEVDTTGVPPGTNPLYLPVLLPPRVYIVATMRNVPLNVLTDRAPQTVDIEQDSAGNVADIREYVRQAAARLKIQAYAVAHGINEAQFIDLLTQKSQGNFMYLRYVLPEIESGAYKDLKLEEIPTGLRNYYQDHWNRMKGQNADEWFKYKLPVLMALTVVHESVSIDQLEEFSDVDSPRIRTVLQEWQPFLYEEEVSQDGRAQKRYRVYHASFHDFIAEKEEIADERVNRQRAHDKIAEKLLRGLQLRS